MTPPYIQKPLPTHVEGDELSHQRPRLCITHRMTPWSLVAHFGLMSAVLAGGVHMDRWVKTHVRSSCELEINSEEGVLTFVSHPGASPLYDPLIIDEMLEDRPALCLVKSSSMTSAPKSSGRVAMLSFATTAKYLAQNSRKHIALLKALEDRAKWAVQYDMPYYIWIGTMNDAEAPIEGGTKRFGCNEDGEGSLHIIKVIAMLALLEMTEDYGLDNTRATKRFDTIMYTDMDTVPVRSDVSLEAYLNLDRDVDIIASSNPRNAIIMNSGVLFMRNTEWSRNFLENWWRRRCGFKDQLSLWSTLFDGWSKSIPSFRDHPEIFHNYSIARDLALPRLIEIRRQTWPALRMEPWPCENLCDVILARNACISEPLRLPNVLLLPVGAFNNGRGRMLPPLQGTGTYALFCHGVCGDLTKLNERPWGCTQVFRELAHKEATSPPTAQCAQCRHHRCEECSCAIPYDDGSQTIPRNARHSDSRECKSAWNDTKVFGIGWRRTGLTSLREAFRLAGLLPACVVEKENYDVEVCKSSVTRSPTWTLKSILDLKEKYPQARFVLTTREIGAWNASIREYSFANKHQRNLVGSNRRFIAAHVSYIESVLTLFSDQPKRLLVIDISKPPKTLSNLCTFIDPAISAARSQCSLPFPFKSANCRLHGQELGRNGAECAIL